MKEKTFIVTLRKVAPKKQNILIFKDGELEDKISLHLKMGP